MRCLSLFRLRFVLQIYAHGCCFCLVKWRCHEVSFFISFTVRVADIWLLFLLFSDVKMSWDVFLYFVYGSCCRYIPMVVVSVLVTWRCHEMSFFVSFTARVADICPWLLFLFSEVKMSWDVFLYFVYRTVADICPWLLFLFSEVKMSLDVFLYLVYCRCCRYMPKVVVSV